MCVCVCVCGGEGICVVLACVRAYNVRSAVCFVFVWGGMTGGRGGEWERELTCSVSYVSDMREMKTLRTT